MPKNTSPNLVRALSVFTTSRTSRQRFLRSEKICRELFSLPVFRRRYAVLLFERVFKIVAVGKAAAQRDFRHRIVCGNKFQRGALQPYEHEVLVHAYARRLAESAA